MKPTNVTKDNITISFTPSEVAFICNALREALRTADAEFHTLTGRTSKEGEEIRIAFCQMYDESKKKSK